MNLSGIFAPLTTPFAPDGQIAPDRLRSNIERYNRTKLSGYALNGSTGESVLLRWDEIYRLWEAAKISAAPGKILIAGTGAESTAETIEHTARAADLGFDAALVRTPSFYKPAISDDLLAAHFLRVADAARIPVLLYSVPLFTHVAVEAPLVARLAAHPNIVGMKDSSGDVRAAAEIIAAAPQSFRMLTGFPGTLHESLQAGAAGAILAVACAFPELCCEIYDASCAGDAARSHSLAQRLQLPSQLFGRKFGISGLKFALDRLGYFGGPPRPPLLTVDKAAQSEIEEMLPGVLAASGAAAKP